MAQLVVTMRGAFPTLQRRTTNTCVAEPESLQLRALNSKHLSAPPHNLHPSHSTISTNPRSPAVPLPFPWPLKEELCICGSFSVRGAATKQLLKAQQATAASSSTETKELRAMTGTVDTVALVAMQEPGCGDVEVMIFRSTYTSPYHSFRMFQDELDSNSDLQ